MTEAEMMRRIKEALRIAEQEGDNWWRIIIEGGPKGEPKHVNLMTEVKDPHEGDLTKF